MSNEEITDVQPVEPKENGEQEAPAAIQQEQQVEAKEVYGCAMYGVVVAILFQLARLYTNTLVVGVGSPV